MCVGQMRVTVLNTISSCNLTGDFRERGCSAIYTQARNYVNTVNEMDKEHRVLDTAR